MKSKTTEEKLRQAIRDLNAENKILRDAMKRALEYENMSYMTNCIEKGLRDAAAI